MAAAGIAWLANKVFKNGVAAKRFAQLALLHHLRIELAAVRCGAGSAARLSHLRVLPNLLRLGFSRGAQSETGEQVMTNFAAFMGLRCN